MSPATRPGLPACTTPHHAAHTSSSCSGTNSSGWSALASLRRPSLLASPTSSHPSQQPCSRRLHARAAALPSSARSSRRRAEAVAQPWSTAARPCWVMLRARVRARIVVDMVVRQRAQARVHAVAVQCESAACRRACRLPLPCCHARQADQAEDWRRCVMRSTARESSERLRWAWRWAGGPLGEIEAGGCGRPGGRWARV